MLRQMIRGAVFVMLGLCLVNNAAAQEKKEAKKGDSSGGYSAIIDNIDMLVDNYAKFLGRKYDLNDEQFNFTKQMIRDKVNGFLDHHEEEVRELFDQMFQARTQGNMGQEDLIHWGKRVAPIYEEAKKIIEGGNTEWREILDDKQRAIHDEDLKLMADSFKETDEKVERIQQGQMTIDEFVKPSGGGPRKPRRSPPPVVDPPPAVNADGSPVEVVTSAAGETKTVVRPHNKQTKAIAHAERGKREQAGLDNPAANEKPGPAVDPATGQPVQVDEPPVQPLPDGSGEQPQPAVVEPHPANPEPQPPIAGNRNASKSVQPKTAGKNFESEWQKYVREFIQKYQLNDEQTQRANAILAECETAAERVMTSKKSELERIEKRETELKGAAGAAVAKPVGDPKAAGEAKAAAEVKTKELGELTKRRDELLAPINRIFEDQLKPKLEKLPTRAQRKAAEEKSPKAPAAHAGKPGEKDTKGSDKDAKPADKKP